MLKAISFDFDGVLLKSVDVKTQAFKKLFSSEKPAVLQRIIDYHLKNGGVSRFKKFETIYKKILRRPLSKQGFNLLCEKFSDLVKNKVLKASWIPGAKEFLHENKNKYLFFVISATPDTEIKEIVEKRGIKDFFKGVYGSPREKHLLLQEILKKYAIAPNEMVYIGDAVNDWQAAQRARVHFIWKRVQIDVPLPSNYTGLSIFTLKTLNKSLRLLDS